MRTGGFVTGFVTAAALLLIALLIASDAPAQTPSVHPNVPLTGIVASSGNVAAGTATSTLPAAQGRFTYLCGFSITSSGSTAALVVQPTVTGLNGGTLTYTYASVAGATLANAPLVVTFPTCMPSSAPNTAIVVTVPSLGAGNTSTTVNAWGAQ
jgi:hypothetical protein